MFFHVLFRRGPKTGVPNFGPSGPSCAKIPEVLPGYRIWSAFGKSRPNSIPRKYFWEVIPPSNLKLSLIHSPTSTFNMVCHRKGVPHMAPRKYFLLMTKWHPKRRSKSTPKANQLLCPRSTSERVVLPSNLKPVSYTHLRAHET